MLFRKNPLEFTPVIVLATLIAQGCPLDYHHRHLHANHDDPRYLIDRASLIPLHYLYFVLKLAVVGLYGVCVILSGLQDLLSVDLNCL